MPTPVAAILLVFAAGVIFAVLDTSAKYLVLSGMSPAFIVWVRFASHAVLAVILLQGWRNTAMFKVANPWTQLLRGIFLFGSTTFNFFALETLQLAEAMTIAFFAPIVITALAGPLLGEWAGWRRWVAIAVGFIGILVVVRPGFGEFGIGYAYSLLSVLSHCFYVIMTRHMGATETSGSLIFYSALVPVVLLSPAVPVAGSIPPGALHWIILLSLGIYGGIGHWLIIKAYRLAPVSALAPYPYAQLIWGVALGYLVFGDVPDRYTIIGAMIIVASGLYILHRERQLRLATTAAPNAEDEELAKKL